VTLTQKHARTAAEIETWLVEYLTGLLAVDPKRIDVNVPFARYGLDSTATVGLTGDLATWLGSEMDAGLAYSYPSIRALAKHLGTHNPLNPAHAGSTSQAFARAHDR